MCDKECVADYDLEEKTEVGLTHHEPHLKNVFLSCRRSLNI